MPHSAIDLFESQRGRMFGIAYRMLGSAADAEDVVQDAWLRWSTTDHDAVEDAGAFLSTVVTRLAINQLDSARVRRQAYPGPWLPEPVSTEVDPALGAETREALAIGVLLLMERLTAAERAAFVLHEAFAYPYQRIAEVLETTAANARQLASRARAHLERERGTAVPRSERDRLLHAVLAAAQHGDLEALEAVLSEGVVTFSDGGGIVSAARRPVVGADNVARFVLGVIGRVDPATMRVRVVDVNGEPAVFVDQDGTPVGVWTIDADAQGVSRLMIIVNPEKLERIGAALSHS